MIKIRKDRNRNKALAILDAVAVKFSEHMHDGNGARRESKRKFMAKTCKVVKDEGCRLDHSSGPLYIPRSGYHVDQS